MKIGKIISVSELGVEILTDGTEVRYRDMLYTELNGKHYRFEVQAVEGSIVQRHLLRELCRLKERTGSLQRGERTRHGIFRRHPRKSI